MKASRVAGFLVVASAALAIGACGGASTTLPGGGGGGGGDQDSGTGGGGDASVRTGCPAASPASGSACPGIGLECEYGTSANVACNQVVQCAMAGWTPTAFGTCPAGECPASYGDVPVQKTCATEGLVCSYSQGICTCSSGGPARPGGPGWSCSTPEAGCPSPRPLLGSACAQEGMSCDYGACYGGVALECTRGAWHEGEVACPATAGP